MVDMSCRFDDGTEGWSVLSEKAELEAISRKKRRKLKQNYLGTDQTAAEHSKDAC